jgi:hypothetical protein
MIGVAQAMCQVNLPAKQKSQEKHIQVNAIFSARTKNVQGRSPSHSRWDNRPPFVVPDVTPS